jgi:hypothetical protein
MKKYCLTFLISTFCFLQKSYSQEIRTFNTVNFSAGVSGIVHNYSLSVGEMLQLNKKLPFRLLLAAQYTGKITRPGTWSPDLGTVKSPLSIKSTIFSSNLNLPLGGEIFYRNLGIGLVQEIININFVKNFDSTKADLPKNFALKSNGVTNVFSKKNNLNTALYFIYTINDSFSLKFGINKGNELFNYYDGSKKMGFSKIRDNSLFFSFRTNIEK